MRESIEADTDPILDRDHPMFDESIDYTPDRLLEANLKLTKQ